MRTYYEDGFLVLEGFLDESEVAEAQDGVTGLVDELASKLVRAGKISSDYGNTSEVCDQCLRACVACLLVLVCASANCLHLLQQHHRT